MALLQKVKLDQLLPGATVYVLKEAIPLFHAIDVAKIVTGKDKNQAAEAIRNIPSDMFEKKRFQKRKIKLPSGSVTTKFVTYEDILKLIMALGGKNTDNFKAQFAEIMTSFFAGDSTLVPVLTANATSNAPIHALARESETMGGGRVLTDGEAGIKDTGRDGEEANEVAKATKTALDNVSRQKDEMTQVKALADYICEKQVKGAEAQIKAEEAKQATFTQENTALATRYALELSQMDALGKRHAEKNKAELDFIKNKRLALEGPLVMDIPPVAAAPVLDPKSVMEIAEGEDFWKGLTISLRVELVNTVGRQLKNLKVYAMPNTALKRDPRGKEWETNVYASQDHSGVRGALYSALKEMTKKLPKGQAARVSVNGGRQPGIGEFHGFTVEVRHVN